MISESQQEQATLYALGLLDADEALEFENLLASDSLLVEWVRELQETAATLALAADESARPAADLKARVLASLPSHGSPFAVSTPENFQPPPVSLTDRSADLVRPRFGWMPWSLAALLLGCTVFLAVEHGGMLRQIQDLQRQANNPAPPPLEALSKVAFLELEPTPDASLKPRAAILWDAARHQGVLRITRFPPPAPGKDYQLWAVEAGQKATVNAGLVRVEAGGHAEIAFHPDRLPGDNHVVALAISEEQAGGSPTNQGPILFLGKF